MKNHIVSFLIISSSSLFCASPNHDNKTQLNPDSLGANLAKLLTFHYPSASAPENPSFAFANQQEALKKGWTFKKQQFNHGEIVLVPEWFLGLNPERTSDSAKPLLAKQDCYIYGLCIGMNKDEAIIQRLFQYNNEPQNTFITSEKKSMPTHIIGKLPENDL